MDFKFNFGELTYYERKKLYSYVLDNNPNIIFDIGTGKGGATFVMLGAIGNDAKIYSCDPERMPNFESDQLIFYNTRSEYMINKLVEENIYPDFIFFDGPEDPNVAIIDFIILDKYVGVGTVFVMHDWCCVRRKLDQGVSTKAKFLKNYIKSLNNWSLIEELSGVKYRKGKESVGMCYYKKIGV